VSTKDRQRRLVVATERVVRPGSNELPDLEAADDLFWDAVPIDERLLLAFALSVQQWRLHGWREDRSRAGLSRSVARVHRP